MFGIKKKLGALVSGEGARGALQNVLTVEWSGGHKTVLVEVPNAGTSRTNEVEMSGMGDSSGDYGRLTDDDDEDRVRFNTSRGYFDQPRSMNYNEDDTPPALPPKPIYSPYIDSRNDRTESRRGYNPSNPFSSVNDDVDVDEYTVTSDRRYQASSRSRQNRQDDLLTFDEGVNRNNGWETFLQPSSIQRNGQNGQNTRSGRQGHSGHGIESLDPWAGRGWGTGNGQGQTSPTSSTGTRHSAQIQQMDDPFRN